jgi:hypothetical protein
MSNHDSQLYRSGMLTMLALLMLASPAAANSIFVGNLSVNLSSDELANLFAPYGEVSSAKVIMDPQTGKSKGYGFVEMPNDEAARSAVAGLDEQTIDGRPIRVNVVSEPREGSGVSRPGGGGFGGSRESGGYGGGRRPGSSAPTPAAKPADTPPVAPPAPTPPKAPEPAVAPTQPTPQAPLGDDASDETPDAETEPLEGTPDLADESEISVADDEGELIDEEEEAEDDGAMTDQESGADATDDAAEVSEEDFGQAPSDDEATDAETGDAVEDEQPEDSDEPDEPEDAAEVRL